MAPGTKKPTDRTWPPGSAHVQVAQSLAEFGLDEWDRLAAASAAPVFYSSTFLRSIEHQPLTSDAQPYYLAIRGSDGLAAATVVYHQTGVNPFVAAGAAPENMLVGHLWHCYDTRLLSRGPVTADLVAIVAKALDRLADELGVVSRGLCNIPAAGVLAGAIGQDQLAKAAPRYQLRPRPGEDSEQHLSRIGKSSRRTMRKYLRRAAESGLRVSFDVATPGLRADVLELCLATANKHAPGYYPPGPLGHLLRALGPDCRVLRLDLSGKLLACSICLFDAGAAHFWAGGSLYPAELNWSPQYVLFGEELRHGFATGRRVIEFGRRNDDFKLRHGLQSLPLASWLWGN